jgi:hypothetical protein
MLEAGVRQFAEWGNTDPGRHILIAVARYLAAHSPTERAVFQIALSHNGCCAAASSIRIREHDGRWSEQFEGASQLLTWPLRVEAV